MVDAYIHVGNGLKSSPHKSVANPIKNEGINKVCEKTLPPTLCQIRKNRPVIPGQKYFSYSLDYSVHND